MIKFFRKSRQNLLSNDKPALPAGRFRKYIFYAIGEVVLVVLGILIALQINNWNQKNIESKKEAEIIQSLYVELYRNESYLIERDKFLSRTLKNSSRELLGLTSTNPDLIKSREFHTLTNRSRGVPPFNPITAYFSKLISSDEFNLIHLDSLKIFLIEYQSLLDRLRSNYAKLELHMEQNQEPYYHKHLNWRDMAYKDEYFANSFENIDLSEFDIDSKMILSDRQFENIIAGVLMNYGFAEKTNNLLIAHMHNMQGFIEENYNVRRNTNKKG